MIQIGRQWHVNHVVDDYRIVTDWYREVFGAVDVFTDDWLEPEKRWASMVTIADLAVDVMAPTTEGADLPLGRFLKRFGPHLHAAAYFVNSPPADVYDALTAAGVRCFGLAGSGRDALAAKPMSPVFTHPKDTAGQLEFMPFVESKPGPLGVPGKWEDPRFLPGWSNGPWRAHPLALTGWRLGVVVHELERATEVYAALGAHVVRDERSTAAHRRLLTFGTNTLVELIAPHSEDTVAARDLAANGEIMHACVFETADLAAAESHLVEHGVGIAERDGQRLTADPKTCHGAVIEFVGCA
ncbi:VOC family protein [Mycobacterium sp. 236(2023)]|uniref:VOC family protein n=1 Tax=Mycobacterium sp. 236(2023) TaxID=3038163 RepID=UPI0024155C64|nr:VOC family protein [Mycobacterium sp. 236(2023)]MDG4669130.1 VOC family protein [Mycobacterium sp. 236(2023)]